MKIYVTGVSGTGKTTIARALAARGIPAIDMDDICSWQHRASGEKTGWEPGKSEDWYGEHGWICNVIDLKEFLETHQSAVALGLSSNQDEYLPLFDKIFVLISKPEVFVERINTRTDNIYGKHPVEQARLLNWHKQFEAEMLAKGALPLDADRPLNDVVEELVGHLNA